MINNNKSDYYNTSSKNQTLLFGCFVLRKNIFRVSGSLDEVTLYSTSSFTEVSSTCSNCRESNDSTILPHKGVMKQNQLKRNRFCSVVLLV